MWGCATGAQGGNKDLRPGKIKGLQRYEYLGQILVVFWHIYHFLILNTAASCAGNRKKGATKPKSSIIDRQCILFLSFLCWQSARQSGKMDHQNTVCFLRRDFHCDTVRRGVFFRTQPQLRGRVTWPNPGVLLTRTDMICHEASPPYVDASIRPSQRSKGSNLSVSPESINQTWEDLTPRGLGGALPRQTMHPHLI